MFHIATMHHQIAAQHWASHVKAIKGSNVSAGIANGGT
jgi:hypothetical protein